MCHTMTIEDLVEDIDYSRIYSLKKVEFLQAQHQPQFLSMD